MSALQDRPLASVGAAKLPTVIESRFRNGLIVASVLTIIALGCHAATMLWAQNEYSVQETIVSAQSQMLAHDGTLYYDLKSYPYTVCAYTPLFYLLEAGLFRVGLPALLAGRVVSLAALAALIFLCFRIAGLYTRNRYAAWCAGLFAASSPLLMNWGTAAQVDTLACAFAAASFYYFSQFYLLNRRTLALALFFSVLAVYSKQTAVAVTAAACVLLLGRSWKLAVAYGAAWVAAVAGIALTVNAMLHGRFFADTIFANMNPMSGHKLSQQLTQFLDLDGALLLIAAVGALSTIRAIRGPVVYLCFAIFVFLGTAPKIGSDTNYQMETTAVLAICGALAMHSLKFFDLYFARRKSWITLLLLPAALHVFLGYRATFNNILFRYTLENSRRAAIAGLQPYVPKAGLVFSTDYGAVTQLRGRLDIETFFYELLVSAGKVDPEPVRRDLERGAFSRVILSQDLFQVQSATDIELGALPESHLEAIRRSYHLMAHISKPGIEEYVYEPNTNGGA